jgi:hypothetical protein
MAGISKLVFLSIPVGLHVSRTNEHPKTYSTPAGVELISGNKK